MQSATVQGKDPPGNPVVIAHAELPQDVGRGAAGVHGMGAAVERVAVRTIGCRASAQRGRFLEQRYGSSAAGEVARRCEPSRPAAHHDDWFLHTFLRFSI